jgi:hypothetical protein
VADLTTVAAVKKWLGIKDATDDDTLLSSLVSGVSRWIENWLSRTIASATYAETLDGNGKDAIFLTNTPITAVSSVKVNGVSIPARASVTGSGYTFDEDGIYLVGYCFTKGRRNVDLGYTAGFASTPEDLELATKKLVGMSYKEKDRIGQSSKGLAGEQTNFIVKDLPADVECILQNYKRVVPVSV